MTGTVLLVHSGRKIRVGQRAEQILRIDTVHRKGENGILTGYPGFDCIVLVIGRIDYYSSSVTLS